MEKEEVVKKYAIQTWRKKDKSDMTTMIKLCGATRLFDRKEDAEVYARNNCIFNYKVIAW
jgi:hypothetical protein